MWIIVAAIHGKSQDAETCLAEPAEKCKGGPLGPLFAFYGAPGEIAQDIPVLRPSGRRYAASKIAPGYFVELRSATQPQNQPNTKPAQGRFCVWRARRDSNSRPPGS